MGSRFLIQFDSKSYKKKPDGNEVAKIKKRTQLSKPLELTAKEILNKILTGHSYSPGILKGGLKAENWEIQQIFGIDIDNDNKNEPILTPKKAIETLKSQGIRTFGIYYSFSSTKEKPRFRILVALDKPVADEALRKIITKALFSIFPQADKSCMNADRIFFGTNKNAKFSTQVNSFEQFLEIYNLNEEAATETTHLSELDKLKNEFDFENYLVKDLQLEILSENDNSIKSKHCPICGHNKCFVYYKNTKTFYCYGQHGLKGGSIIDFLMITKKLSRNEAIDYFKKELCHIDTKQEEIHTPVPLYSAYDLMQEEIPEPYYCVENLIYQGLTILAAPPKGYKSWLILHLCLCVAKGTDFLGFKTQQSSVVYFALEDSNRRVRKRLQKISKDGKLPKNYYLVHKAVNLEGGFVSDLEYYLKQDPNIKLLVVDTLQVVRGMYKNQNVYAKDYEDVRALKSFADKHNVCIIVVHHVKKDNKKTILYLIEFQAQMGLWEPQILL